MIFSSLREGKITFFFKIWESYLINKILSIFKIAIFFSVLTVTFIKGYNKYFIIVRILTIFFLILFWDFKSLDVAFKLNKGVIYDV